MVESTFIMLKTGVDLRPIYQKQDASTMAHLHLGLLVGKHDTLSAKIIWYQ